MNNRCAHVEFANPSNYTSVDYGRLIALQECGNYNIPIHVLRVYTYKIWYAVASVLFGTVFLYLFIESSSSDLKADRMLDYIPPHMLHISSGTFMMGVETSSFDHEKAEILVSVPAFKLARNELTWAEWKLCEDEGGCATLIHPEFLSEIDVHEQLDHPVVNLSIDSVNEYLDWISEKTGLAFRLPSEAEWEFAAGAGNTTTYFWGNTIGENNANCNGCGSQWDHQSTAPVGSFSANPLGLHDMQGNVWEWVADFTHDNCQGTPLNDSAHFSDCSSGRRQVIRGGSWDNTPEFLRTRSRYKVDSATAFKTVGFRLAMSLP